MGRGHDEPAFVGSITHYETIDQVFGLRALITNDGDQANPITQAIFDEGRRLRRVGKGAVENDLRRVGHMNVVPISSGKHHPYQTIIHLRRLMI